MKKVTFFDIPIIYKTYSHEEYDRTNGNLPTLLLKFDARDFGGKYNRQLNNVYIELNMYKNSEMIEAVTNAKKNKLIKINQC